MTVPQFEKLKLDCAEGVACITLEDPPVMNAMGMTMARNLSDALDVVSQPDLGVRCLVLTGAGTAFCSGANITDGAFSDGKVDVRASLEEGYHPPLRKLRELNLPIVVAVSGAAAGIGMSFALMGDIVLAARSAFFTQAFVHIGLVPDGGSTWALPRLVGLQRAKALSLLGERLDAQTAMDWGLVYQVIEDETLQSEARALAARLAAGPTRAYALMRQAYWESLDNDYESQLAVECEAQVKAAETADFQEGIAAFLEKRKPDFKGR